MKTDRWKTLTPRLDHVLEPARDGIEFDAQSAEAAIAAAWLEQRRRDRLAAEVASALEDAA